MKVFRDDVAAKSDNFVMSTLKQLIDYDWNTDDQINPSKSESTQVCIHVGHVSRGKIAISGKDGHFFCTQAVIIWIGCMQGEDLVFINSGSKS